MKTKRWIALTVICIAFTQMGGAGLAPMLSDLAGVFPEAAPARIQLVSTLPAIFILIASYLAVRAARLVPKKRLLTLGTGLILLFALLGWALHPSLAVLYVWSAVLGTGVGICNTLATVYINDFFTGSEKISLLGKQTFAASAGMMLMTFIGGFLVQRKWYLGYLPFLIVVPALVLTVVGLPDAGPAAKREDGGNRSGSGAGSGKDAGYLKKTLFPMFMAFMVTLLYTVCVTNTSMYIAENHFGTAAQAGAVMTLLSLTGGICGLLLGHVTGKIGTVGTMFLGFAMMAAGYLGFWAAGSFPVVIVSAILSGGAISFVMPGATFLAAEGEKNRPDEAIAATLMSSNFGNLLSPVLTILTPLIFRIDNARMRFLFGALLVLPVLGILAAKGRKK